MGRFQLMRKLGQGNMGMVIQARDTHLGRIVALKVLRKRVEGVDERKHVEQFLREDRSAARIDHPNAAAIYEINEHRGWWYIATEYLEGGSLDQVVRSVGPLDPDRACPIIADAASVLAVAHQAGIIHRDIKPHNLMLTRTGRCKVVDWGLVRVEDPNDPFDFTNQAVGTPNYMAPECANDVKPTPAFDVYALGATLYFTLTGDPPFRGKNVPDTLRKHREEPPPSLTERCPDCSKSLAELVSKMLAKDPEQRPTMMQVSQTLRLEGVGSRLSGTDLLMDPTGSRTAELDGSGMGSNLGSRLAPADASHASRSASMGFDEPAASARAWAWVSRVAAVAVLVAMVVAGIVWLAGGFDAAVNVVLPNTDASSGATQLPAALPVATREQFAARFPDAPMSYGTSSVRSDEEGAPGGAPDQERDPPVWSWLGQADPDGALYVGNRAGRQYYTLAEPVAALISADQAVFFKDADAAKAAGRSPATP